MNPFYDKETQSFMFSEKFVNFLLVDGKKLKAYNIYFQMLKLLKYKLLNNTEKKLSSVKTFDNQSITQVVESAINNCMPSLEVRKVRVAGTTYLVPTMIQKKKQENLAIRWIVEAAKNRKKSTKLSIAQCLADEVFDAFHKQGYARGKRNELHRLAEANRAYIRYRWW